MLALSLPRKVNGRPHAQVSPRAANGRIIAVHFVDDVREDFRFVLRFLVNALFFFDELFFFRATAMLSTRFG